jgi:hypothetical protein
VTLALLCTDLTLVSQIANPKLMSMYLDLNFRVRSINDPPPESRNTVIAYLCVGKQV